MLRLIQHVLHPVGAVGNLDSHPVGLVVFHSAVPVGTEAEDVTVEVIFRVAAINQKSDVNHVARNCGRRRGRVLTLASLDELNSMSLGIFDDKEMTMVRPFLNLGSFDPL